MKKIVISFLLIILTVLLVSCTNKKPSLEQVEKEINDGTLTVDDAYKRGWVDDKWVENYNKEKEKNTIDASDKLKSNMLDDFETTTIDNNKFTKDNLSKVTYIAFINPTSKEGQEAYNVLQDAHDEIITGSGDALIVTTTKEGTSLYKNCKYPVIYYNKSMETALGKLTEMVHTDGFSGSWNGNGAFLSAWNIKITKDTLINSMKSIVDMVK